MANFMQTSMLDSGSTEITLAHQLLGMNEAIYVQLVQEKGTRPRTGRIFHTLIPGKRPRRECRLASLRGCFFCERNGAA